MEQTPYRLDAQERETAYLLSLRENCALTEQRLLEIADKLCDEDRQYILAYIDIRNELEYQSVLAARNNKKRSFL